MFHYNERVELEMDNVQRGRKAEVRVPGKIRQK